MRFFFFCFSSPFMKKIQQLHIICEHFLTTFLFRSYYKIVKWEVNVPFISQTIHREVKKKCIDYLLRKIQDESPEKPRKEAIVMDSRTKIYITAFNSIENVLPKFTCLWKIIVQSFGICQQHRNSDSIRHLRERLKPKLVGLAQKKDWCIAGK